MDSKAKLGAEERQALERVISRLQAQGFETSDQAVLRALMKAACRLPEEQLLQLLEEGLKEETRPKKARAR